MSSLLEYLDTVLKNLSPEMIYGLLFLCILLMGFYFYTRFRRKKNF